MSENWKKILKDEFEKNYFKELENFLEKEYSERKIYPPCDKVFNLFNNIDYEEIKVVILGQDPYHGEGQGNGIAFSVNPGIKIPPSLRNIYKELEQEYKETETPFTTLKNGDLTPWVKQGVFLLNATLTVREGEANSHAKSGWEFFTTEVIKKINEKETPVVFLLWGDFARKKKEFITNSKHLVLESTHPSPFSANRGFLGCNHFKMVNEFLEKNRMKPIDWRIKEDDEESSLQMALKF